ncbi:hypothetical protein, partial [uncultured Bilophila sp.]|uniref:hypothetical protein n=1 Tax=uncultured Bilophila sp. TaxID=529385 RepID=UPI00266EE3C0
WIPPLGSRREGRELRIRHFAGYPFGARKKASTIFYNTAYFFEQCCIFLQPSSVMGKIQQSVNMP